MSNIREPTAHNSAKFWDQPDSVLRQTLRTFVEDPKTLINMTTEQLQAELRRQLQDSVGA